MHMAIRRDLSQLPTAAPDTVGNIPDATPRFLPELARAWKKQRDSHRDHAIEGTRFRGSNAGRCARALAYTFQGVEPSNPPDLAAEWRMGIGTMVHDALEEAIVAAFPKAQVEVKIDYRPALDGSGHGDLMIAQVRSEPHEDGIAGHIWRTHIELKTINGFGFKRAVGATKGPADGPRDSGVIQGALNAYFDKADELVIGYLSLENMGQYLRAPGDDEGISLFVAEWSYTKAEFTAIAEAEIARVNEILSLVDRGQKVGRAIVDSKLTPGAVVTDPSKGLWVVRDEDDAITDTGSTWQCDYCDHRDTCIADGP